MARVIISAGHTQQEPGAVVDNLREVDFTRKISNKVTSHLRKQGIITLSVPPELELPARIDWINKTGYREETEDICIEIHINDGGKTGIEGWYKDKGENNSYKLTKNIVDEIVSTTGLTNQGVKSEYDHELQSLAFLHNTNPTSALIECLYLDNPEDQKFLQDDSKLDKLAQGIVNGIKKFFGIDSSTLPNKQNLPNQNKKPGTFPTGSTYPQNTTGSFNHPYPSYRPNLSAYSKSPQFGKPQTSTLSRDQQKKMIKDNYRKILGRKVKDQDLNYFLNLKLNESQMIKRLIDSQDHANLVKNSQKYEKIKPKYDKLKLKAKELKSQVKDKDNIISKQNELISKKNKKLQEIHGNDQSQAETINNIDMSKDIESSNIPNNNNPLPQQPNYYPEEKKSFFDKILEKLNDIFD